MRGRDEIVQFLTKKWSKEDGYRLRKELFSFTDHKIAVQVCPSTLFSHLPKFNLCVSPTPVLVRMVPQEA